MKLIVLTIVSLSCVLAAGVANVDAQSVGSPPGFSPGLDDQCPSSPAPEPHLYSGSGDDFPSSSESVSAPPLRRRRIAPDGFDRARAFRHPASPDLVLDEPPLPQAWFRAESLLWWSKSSPLPIPIVTLGDGSDLIPGALGQPGTSVLIGNQNIDVPTRGGARFTFGFSFNPAQTWGAEISYFSLANTVVSQGVSSDGSPGSALLAFPFYNPTAPGEDSSPLSLPGAFAGTAIISLKSFLQGTDLNLIHNISNSNAVKIDLLGGFRYVNLQEKLLFTTDSPNVFPNPPGFFNTIDQFKTNSSFYGGQLGVRGSIDVNRFFFNATGKLAIGATSETVSVNGGTFTNIGGFASAPGAYLSQPTNMGSLTRSQFAVVPEMNLNVGFRLRPWASVIVGYSFLYISSVARPGDQIDRVINPSQSSAISNTFPAGLSGTARPELNIRSTDFWAQGLNLGLEFRF